MKLKRRIAGALALVFASLALPVTLAIGLASQPGPPSGPGRNILVHLLQRPIGRETFELRQDGRSLVLASKMELVDRESRLIVSSSSRLQADLTPIQFKVTGNT